MITLPYEYKGINNNYQIVGWFYGLLQTKSPDGRIWTLSHKEMRELLIFLQLKPEDIPGYEEPVVKRKPILIEEIS